MNPFPTEDSALDEAIASAHADLKSFSADEEGYQKAVDQLSKLYKLKHEQAKLNLELYQSDLKHTLEKEEAEFKKEVDARPFFKRVDPNTVVTVAGNALVALVVVKYEQKHVIASKVMSFMKKI